ncbi:hypothetical protein ACE1AT_13230 [Pelatocladus sp. BLCC-F211]|uniref:hypothetical protein n=1 Tax=Pelatocladus sp. BLCC-F211 TaxID=3342752 RepID=UPI0035B87283
MCGGICNGCGPIHCDDDFCAVLHQSPISASGDEFIADLLDNLSDEERKPILDWVALCGKDFHILDELGIDFLGEEGVLEACTLDPHEFSCPSISEFKRVATRRVAHNLHDYLKEQGVDRREDILAAL